MATNSQRKADEKSWKQDMQRERDAKRGLEIRLRLRIAQWTILGHDTSDLEVMLSAVLRKKAS